MRDYEITITEEIGTSSIWYYSLLSTVSWVKVTDSLNGLSQDFLPEVDATYERIKMNNALFDTEANQSKYFGTYTIQIKAGINSGAIDSSSYFIND